MIVRSCEDPAVWVADPVITKRAAVPGSPVAVKVTGDPVRPDEVAVSVFEPAVVPSVHAGDVAMPDASVVTVPEGASEPPPDATVNVTDVPWTALP